MANSLGNCQIERTRHYQWRLIASITWRDLAIIRIKRKMSTSNEFRSKRSFTSTGGHMLTSFFWKKQVKKGKEKQLTKNQGNRPIEERERLVNRTRRWSRELKSVGEPAGQSIGR
jgi:hypothetical protein